MTKYIGYGSSLATSTGDIGQIRSIDGFSIATDDVDTTTLDSSTNYRTFTPGLRDAGELSIEVAFDSGLATHKLMNRLQHTGTITTWTVVYNTSSIAVESFEGYVKSCGRTIPLDDLIVGTYTIKLTGKPTLST